MKVSIILYKSKTLSDGSHPLMVRISENKTRKYLATGLSCPAAGWNFQKNAPKRNNPHGKYLEAIIDKKKSAYQLQILSLESQGINPTIQQIIQAVEKPKQVKESIKNEPIKDVFTFLAELVDRLRSCGKIKRSNLYKLLYNSLKQFNSHKQLYFSDIDVDFLNQYEAFLYKGGRLENTISTYFKLLRALLNKALKANYMKKETYPFSNYALSKFSTLTQKRAMRIEDLKKIMDYDLPAGSALAEARDYFLFSYYGRGMNFKDMACLKWKQIVNDRVTYQRLKTGTILNFKLRPNAVAILDRYKFLTEGDPENYVFPILDRYKHTNPIQIVNRVNRVMRRVNQSLQLLARKANIPIHLTTYVARHTYATLLKQNGVSTGIISEALGHQAEQITQTYLKSFSNEVIDAADEVLAH